MRMEKTVVQNGNIVMEDRTFLGDLVLENGKIAFSGTGAELMESEDIKKAYLGG